MRQPKTCLETWIYLGTEAHRYIYACCYVHAHICTYAERRTGKLSPTEETKSGNLTRIGIKMSQGDFAFPALLFFLSDASQLLALI